MTSISSLIRSVRTTKLRNLEQRKQIFKSKRLTAIESASHGRIASSNWTVRN